VSGITPLRAHTRLGSDLDFLIPFDRPEKIEI
jgi:hypothetical protein